MVNMKIEYHSHNAIKGQALTNFLVEKLENLEDVGTDPKSKNLSIIAIDEQGEWSQFVDGASNEDGSGAGLLLTSLEGMEFTYALHINFCAINNEAEYEAVLIELELARKMKSQKV